MITPDTSSLFSHIPGIGLSKRIKTLISFLTFVLFQSHFLSSTSFLNSAGPTNAVLFNNFSKQRNLIPFRFGIVNINCNINKWKNCCRIRFAPLFAKIRKVSKDVIGKPGKRSNMFTTTNSLILANIMAFWISSKNPYLQKKYMKINYMIKRGDVYRLFSSLFMHGSLSHLLMNSYSLYQLGPNVCYIVIPLFIELLQNM